VTAGPDPDPGRRATIILGVVLIVVGGLFMVERVSGVEFGRFGWPLFIVIPGVLLLIAGVALSGSEGTGLAIAGGITTVVGLILAVQNATGLWATWAYAWALVGPGGTGVGLLAYGLVHRRGDLISTGARALGTGLALFAAFGLFFEGVIGLSGQPFLRDSDVLPVVLIGLGVLIIALSLVRRRPAAT